MQIMQIVCATTFYLFTINMSIWVRKILNGVTLNMTKSFLVQKKKKINNNNNNNNNNKNLM